MKKKFGDARDNRDWKGGKSTMPPRSRAGSKFPGSKHMRKALEKLSARQNAFAALKNNVGYTKPGSMQ